VSPIRFDAPPRSLGNSKKKAPRPRGPFITHTCRLAGDGCDPRVGDVGASSRPWTHRSDRGGRARAGCSVGAYSGERA